MKIKQIVFSVYVFLCVLSIMVGCNTNINDDINSQLSLHKTTNTNSTTLVMNTKKVSVADIKKEVQSIDAIYDVAVIKGKTDTLVSYKVRHFQRFQIKPIEKEVNSKLEKKYPKENFIVSGDEKIFLAVKWGKK